MRPNLRLTALFAATVVAISSCSKTPDTVVPFTSVNYVSTTPVLSRFSPASALPNSAISLLGTNFTTDVTKITVTFGGVAATVYSATATEIVVGVPATAKTGSIVLVCNGTTLTSTNVFTVVGGTQSTYGASYLEHVALDLSGYVYGENNNAITRISPLNVVLTPFNNVATVLKSIWGTAVDASGNVFFAEPGNKRIDKIAVGSGGAVTVLAGSGATAYTDGTGTAAAFLTGPRGLCIDLSGNLYTTDGLRVRKITPAGVVTTLAGTGVAGNVDGPAATAQFGGLEGIAVDAAGNVYVDDTFNKTIREISAAGVVSTIAGTAGTAGFADGQGVAATFFAPQGMAVDGAGNIFVSDNQSTPTSVVYAIRMINKAGLVSTFLKNTYATQALAPVTVTNGVVANANTAAGAVLATTNFPDGIAFDSAGNMYIANTGASVVSKIIFN